MRRLFFCYLVGTDGEVRAHYCDVFCLVYVCLCVAYIMPVLQLHSKTITALQLFDCFWREALICGIITLVIELVLIEVTVAL
jgi:hypothetical protein